MDNIKGSRRKQTKPNRMPFGVDPHHYPRQPGDLPGMEGERMDRAGDSPMDMSVGSCERGEQTFSSSVDLLDHRDLGHGAGPPLSQADDSFPTAYHRLGSQLVQENASAGPEQAEDVAESLRGPPPLVEAGDGATDPAEKPRDEEPPGTGSGARMLQPDDTDFSSKWLLDTHGASKHGVYPSRDSPTLHNHFPPTLPMDPPPPHPSPSSTVDQAPSPWQPQPPLPQPSPLNKETREEPAESARKREAEQTAEDRVTSVISAVKSSLQSARPPAGKASSTTKDPSSEDYCEFCQKHFCNKYYLKKHKQDVHGIIPETGPTPTKRSRGSSSSNNSLLDLPSSAMGSPMLLPPPLASLGGGGLAGLPPGMMMLNPFMPQMSLMPPGSMPQSLLHPHQLLPPHPLSPGGSQGMMGGQGRGPTTPSPHGSGASPRSETVCSLCKKEFSNVYFLKIHQAHKHGLHSEDVDHEARLLGDMVESSGVVLRPSPPAPARGEVKQEDEGSARPSPPPLTSATLCQLCDREFPSVRTLKVHQVTEHGRRFDLGMHDDYIGGFNKTYPPTSSGAVEAPFSRRTDYDMYSRPAAFGGERASSLPDRVACDICNMDMDSKHALKMHRMKVHGIGIEEDSERSSSGDGAQQPSPGIKEDAAQPLNMSLSARSGPPPLMLPTSEMLDFRDYNRDMSAMEKAAFKTFTDVPSILSETINNEYGFRRSQMQGPPFSGLDFSMRSHPSAALTKMEVDQLVREGIDPEAYCNICKKELCSKYFLRTHMEKTHGIRMDIPSSNHSRSKPGPKPAGQGKVGSLRDDPLRPVFPMSAMPLGFPPGLMPPMDTSARGGAGSGQARGSFEKSHFRWKAPNSATARVTCDICHKEVCNKYFLRTHKLKKHGVAPSDTTSSSDSSTTTISQSGPSSTPVSRPDNFLMDKGTAMLQRPDAFPIPYSIPLPPSDRPAPRLDEQQHQQKQQQQQLQHQHKPSRGEQERAEGRYNGEDGSPVDRVTSKHWLLAHQLRDQGQAAAPTDRDQQQYPPIPRLSSAAEPGQDPHSCPVCHLMLPSLISMQLHLVHKHNAHVKLQMGDAPSEEEQSRPLSASARSVGLRTAKVWKPRARTHSERKLKMFVCSYGDYRTNWLYKLQAHEEMAHGISAQGHKRKSRSEQMPEVAGQPFKCGLCPCRFPTHANCHDHLREKHIHVLKDFVSRKRRRDMHSRLSCRFCSYTTSFPFRLHSHVSRVHSSMHCLQDGRDKSFTDLANMVSSETPPDSVHGSPDHTDEGEGEETESPFDLSLASHAQDPGLRLAAEDSADHWPLAGRRI